MTTKTEGPAHASLSPSSAKRWSECAGSVRAIAELPPAERNKASTYSAEGTVAHAVAYDYATGKVDALELAGLLGEFRKQDGFDIEISEEMIDGAIEYKRVLGEDCAALLGTKKMAPVQREFERRVHARGIDDAVWGTLDAALYRKGDRLIVYDYKFGKGLAVEVAENEQLAIYLHAARETFAGHAFNEMELVVIQPRASHAGGRVRRWKVAAEWLAEFVANMKAKVAKTREPDAPLVAGDWCRSTFCPVKRCPARAAKAMAEAQADFGVLPNPALAKAEAHLPQIRMMTDEQLVDAFRWEGFLEAFSKGVRDVLQERANSGTLPPGLKLVEGRSNRQWVSEDAVVARYGPVLGDAIYEKSILSPAKLEKAARLKKGAVDDLTFKPPGKKSVALDTDARPAASPAAQDAFTALTAENYKCPGCDTCAVLGTCSPAVPAAAADSLVWPQ